MESVVGPASAVGVAWGAAALGATTGLRIFLAPFVLALVATLGALPHAPGWLTSPAVAAAVAALVVAEVAGDKLAGFDHALDAAGLVLRPAWAAGVVFAFDPAAGGAAGLAAAVSFLVGLGKTRLRVESEARGAWQAPIESLALDLLAAALVALALAWPAAGLACTAAAGVGLHGVASALGRRRWEWSIGP
ncbi:MAG: DUF4126 domain-containing protein [Myxococcota bacterium]